MRLFARTVACALGALFGVLFFYTADKVISQYLLTPHKNRASLTQEYRHSGIVTRHDRASKTLSIQEESSFQMGTSTGEVQFTYTDETEWSSLEFIFRDNILERRNIFEDERERDLPEGALVWIARDPTTSDPWKIAHLSFIRRTDL